MAAEALTFDAVEKWSVSGPEVKLFILSETNIDARLFLGRPCVGSATQTLGALDVLPSEIRTDVLAHLDIPSLCTFRLVSRRAFHAVYSIPEYRLIYETFPDLFCYIFTTGARVFSFKTLYEAVSSQKCVCCGDFAGFLYLITCERVCYLCFTNDVRFLPVECVTGTGKQAAARRKKLLETEGFSDEALESVPQVRSLRARYGQHYKTSNRRLHLWDRKALMATRGVEVLPPQKGDRFELDGRRFMAIVCVPYLDAAANTLKWGRYCADCSTYSRDPYLYTQKQLSEEGFVEHIEEFGPLTDSVDPRHVRKIDQVS